MIDRFVRGLTGAGLFACALLTAGLAQAVPVIEHWETPNGARVYFVAAPQLPMVDIRVVFDAAAARDGDHPGIGVLTNGLLAEGAGGMDADAIADRFAAVGAKFSNSALRDMSMVSLRSLTDPALLGPALETFTAVLGRPDFPADVLDRERSRMLVALRRDLQSPAKLAEKAFYAALYGDHPYASPVLGTEASLTRLTAADVRAHYQRYFVARNAVVAIVGDLDRAAAERLAQQVTAALKAGERAAPLPPVVPLKQSERAALAHPSTQTHIWHGQVGIARDNPDYVPLYVGNHILGGSGLISRISQEVREKRGLSYSAYSYFSPMRAAGPFVLGLQTANESADEALAVLQQTLAGFVRDGPTAEELAAAKKNITGGFPLDIDSNSDILGFLAMIGYYDLPLDYLATYNAKVEAVTADEVRRVFQRWVDPETMLTVMVGRRG
jgi:zinc protease